MGSTKPRIVDMCIYIDSTIYTDSFDEEKTYEYLQKIFFSLASKNNYFKFKEDLIDFSLFGASRVMMRLQSPRQFLPDTDAKKINKIKSILNFIKSILYPTKVEYQRLNFQQDTSFKELDEEGEFEISENLRYQIQTASNSNLKVDIQWYLSTIHRTIYNFLLTTPYKKDKEMIHKLYISCLLTLLNRTTLGRSFYTHSKDKIYAEDYLNFLYSREGEDIFRWRLPKRFDSYIKVLTLNILKIISSDIKEILRDYDLSDEVVQNILMEPLSEISNDNKGE